jgi:hypothetical protein
MIQSLLIAMGGIVGLMLAWLLVQHLWRQQFADYLTEEDVLAERRSCGNCGCTQACDQRQQKTG